MSTALRSDVKSSVTQSSSSFLSFSSLLTTYKARSSKPPSYLPAAAPLFQTPLGFSARTAEVSAAKLPSTRWSNVVHTKQLSRSSTVSSSSRATPATKVVSSEADTVMHVQGMLDMIHALKQSTALLNTFASERLREIVQEVLLEQQQKLNALSDSRLTVSKFAPSSTAVVILSDSEDEHDNRMDRSHAGPKRGVVEIISSSEESSEEENDDAGSDLEVTSECSSSDVDYDLAYISGVLKEISVRYENEPFDSCPELLQSVGSAMDANRKATERILINSAKQDILRKDFLTLRRATWLNDEIVNGFLNYLAHRFVDEKYLFLNTFFVPTLIRKNGYEYDNVKTWTRGAKLSQKVFRADIQSVFQLRRIFVPLHEERRAHWTMAVIDIENECIYYMDSLAAQRVPRECEVLKRWLADECRDKAPQFRPRTDFSVWPIEVVLDNAIQLNAVDCGVFTCAFAYVMALPNGSLEVIHQRDMDKFRLFIAACILQEMYT
jgi:Ulp1 family protease